MACLPAGQHRHRSSSTGKVRRLRSQAHPQLLGIAPPVIAVIDNPGNPLIVLVRTAHNDYAVHIDEFESMSKVQRANERYAGVKPQPVGTYGGPERTTRTPIFAVVAPLSLRDLPPVPVGICARSTWMGLAAVSFVELHEGFLARAGRLGQ